MTVYNKISVGKDATLTTLFSLVKLSKWKSVRGPEFRRGSRDVKTQPGLHVMCRVDRPFKGPQVPSLTWESEVGRLWGLDVNNNDETNLPTLDSRTKTQRDGTTHFSSTSVGYESEEYDVPTTEL